MDPNIQNNTHRLPIIVGCCSKTLPWVTERWLLTCGKIAGIDILHLGPSSCITKGIGHHEHLHQQMPELCTSNNILCVCKILTVVMLGTNKKQVVPKNN